MSFVVGVVLIDQWWGLLISYNIMYKTNAVFLEIYPGNKRDAPTLEALIKKRVRPGTHILTDCWPAYSKLEKLEGLRVYLIEVFVNILMH